MGMPSPFRRLSQYNVMSPVTPPFLDSSMTDDAEEQYGGGGTQPAPPALDSPGMSAPPPPAASLAARPGPTAREQFAGLKTPVPPEVSKKRQLAAAALNMLPVLRDTNIPGDIAQPGYRQRMNQYKAAQADLQRQTEQEDKQRKLDLEEIQKQSYRENIAALRDNRLQARANQRAQVATAVQKDMENRMAEPASMPDGRTPTLDPDKAETHSLYTAPDGSVWQVPKPDTLAKLKAQQQMASWLPVPEPLKKQFNLPDRVPKEVLDTYARVLESHNSRAEANDLKKYIADQSSADRRFAASLAHEDRQASREDREGKLTSREQDRIDSANSVVEQADHAIAVLKEFRQKHPELFGAGVNAPGAALKRKWQSMTGTDPAEIGEVETALESLAALQPGQHGFRSATAAASFKKSMGVDPRTGRADGSREWMVNPDKAIAGISEVKAFNERLKGNILQPQQRKPTAVSPVPSRPTETQATAPKVADATVIQQYLQKAGGDKQKARQLLTQDGYSIPQVK